MAADRAVEFVRERLTAVDVAVHLAVAAALVAAYLSPAPFEAFLFRPGESGVVGAYRSLLGHADAGHLLANVFGFLVLGGLSAVLLSGVSRRRFYYVSFVSILALVPPLAALGWTLSAAAAPGVGARAGAGFSIVTAAFAGLLAVAASIHQREALAGSPPALVSSACLFALATGVGTVATGGPTAVAVGAGAVALAYLWRSGRGARATLERPDGPVVVSLYAVGLSAFVGATVDLLAGGAARPHAVGLALGFAVVWLVFGIDRLAREATPSSAERSP